MTLLWAKVSTHAGYEFFFKFPTDKLLVLIDCKLKFKLISLR